MRLLLHYIFMIDRYTEHIINTYCRVPPLQGLLVFSGVRTVVEGLDAQSSHNANEASNLCELVTQDLPETLATHFTCTQLQITN